MSYDCLLLSQALLMRGDQHHGYYQESSVLTTCLNFVIETFGIQDWALIGVLHSARVDIIIVASTNNLNCPKYNNHQSISTGSTACSGRSSKHNNSGGK